MSIYSDLSHPFADPPDFGQPDDVTDICQHGVDLMVADCGGCEGPLFDAIKAGDDSEAGDGPDEPGGYWVNTFGQRLRPGAPHFPGDRRVDEPTKKCRGCPTVLGASDPDVCERCDLHEVAGGLSDDREAGGGRRHGDRHPEAAQERCSCWESPRHYVCQCSCHDGGGEQ